MIKKNTKKDLADIRHDLKNTLTPILICARLIEKNKKPDERLKYAQTIIKTTKKLEEMINTLLADKTT